MAPERTAALGGGAARGARRRSAAAWSPSSVALACLCAGLCALALPVALAPVPPLLDYPNHLARMWLLAGGAEQAPLSAMYAADWRAASTNIGVDLLAATLGRAVGGGEALGPLLVFASLVLPPLGAALLNRAVFGGWHWWQAGFALLAFNGTLLAGFLNFQIGLGLALLAASLDPALERRAGPRARLAARAALCSALLVFHVFAAAFYAALLAGLAFGAGEGRRGGGDAAAAAAFRPAARRALGAAGPALGLPLAVFLLAVPRWPGRASDVGGAGGVRPTVLEGVWASNGFAGKLGAWISPVSTYDIFSDVAVLLALWGAARVVAPASLLRVHRGLILAATALAALAVLMPASLGGTDFVDWRLPIMALLTAVAASCPGLRTGRAASLAACALLALGLARTGWVAGVWHGRRADSAAVQRALAHVPAGAAVLPAQHTPPPRSPAPRGRYTVQGLASFWHYPALAVIERRAFVPTLFTAAGKQPLVVVPPWDAIAVPQGAPAPAQQLVRFDRSPEMLYFFGFAEDWRARFDYVLLLNADMPDAHGATLPEADVELLADEGFARLYRVRRDAAALAGGPALQRGPR